MRKIWWVPVICIGAGVVQALVAADYPGNATKKGADSGRSRLLIYSRNKPAARGPATNADPEETPRPARARVAVSDDEDQAPAAKRFPTGNTGTVSPKKPVAAKPAPVAPQLGKSRLPTDEAPFEEATAAAPESDELEDATVRNMFEDIEPTLPLKKLPVRSMAARPATPPRQPVDSPIESISDELPAESVARKSARYKDLLESVRTGSEREVARPTAGRQPVEKIIPVSRLGDSQLKSEFETNPFEASEQPTSVMNAGHEEQQGLGNGRRILPASATTAKPQPTVKPLTLPKAASVAKPTSKVIAPKLPDALKPTVKASAAVVKPAAAAPAANVKVVKQSTPIVNNQAPQVDVKWEARGEVTLGQECQCVLIVQNNGKVPAREIVVEASFPESVRLVDAIPFPKSSTAKLEWQFETLAAGEEKTIALTMVPTKRGELAASAQVRFTGIAATSFQVSEPLLTASLKLPEQVHLNEPASATLTVSNPGTGTAQNVKVRTLLPAGLESASGKDFVTEIGPLGPGESRSVRLALIATAGGEQFLKVIAKSTTAKLEHAAEARINVLAPSLTLSATGPSLRYMHRAAKYVLTATNNSNTSTDNVRITQVVAAGFDFVKADHGGRYDLQSRTASWYVGHLDAGQSLAVELELMPKQTGEFQHKFRVVGDAGTEAAAVVTTRVEGAASLVMEVKDGEDPIEVGGELTYEIRVRNDGSKSASKVAVSCELPPDVELVKVDGPTQHLVESGMLIFKPAAELAAKEALVYKVTVKSSVAGTLKLRARLTSESIQKPLIIEEATQFYAE